MNELGPYDVVVDRKVPSVMRDGTTLYSDVYRPDAPGRYPVILERVAYELNNRVAPYAEFYASRGYVFVGQNSRGTFWSEGEFTGFADDGWGENQDGYDSVEWAAAQPWSDGNVGTMDGSWSGRTQCMLAPTRPPHLRAMFLRMAPAGLTAVGGGIPMVGVREMLVRQTLSRVRHESASPRLQSFEAALQTVVDEPRELVELLPAASFPVVEDVYPNLSLGGLLSGEPDDPATLESDSTRRAADIDVPIFHLGGWYDPWLPETLAMFSAVSGGGFSERARRNQRLLIGPWTHGPLQPNSSVQGGLDFGPDAVLGINEFRLNWFDFWLKGLATGVQELPQTRLFVMGKNEWRDFDEWPPAGAVDTRMFLRAQANDPNGGGLSLEPPTEPEGATSYDYDPFDPVPAYSGGEQGFQAQGPIDLAPSEERLNLFTSEPLESPMTVVGPLEMTLHASSTAKDTDWFVMLSDVWPDGRSMRVASGSLRARYRHGFDRQVRMTPGEPHLFEFSAGATAQVFDAGHRIRLAVTSSQFPPMERNLNTGGDNANEVLGEVAHNTILHNAAHPSHIRLPVMA